MGCNPSVPEDHDENENSILSFTTSMDEDDRTLETLCVA
jgi:hypothetical protein